MFSPRGGGPRGLRPGPWMEGQGHSPPPPGFGFPPRGFAPGETAPDRFSSPVFDERRGGPNIRGRGRGFQGRQEDRERSENEETGTPSIKRSSRWSNMSPPPYQPNNEDRLMADVATAEAIMAEVKSREEKEALAAQQNTTNVGSTVDDLTKLSEEIATPCKDELQPSVQLQDEARNDDGCIFKENQQEKPIDLVPDDGFITKSENSDIINIVQDVPNDDRSELPMEYDTKASGFAESTPHGDNSNDDTSRRMSISEDVQKQSSPEIHHSLNEPEKSQISNVMLFSESSCNFETLNEDVANPTLSEPMQDMVASVFEPSSVENEGTQCNNSFHFETSVEKDSQSNMNNMSNSEFDQNSFIESDLLSRNKDDVSLLFEEQSFVEPSQSLSEGLHEVSTKNKQNINTFTVQEVDTSTSAIFCDDDFEMQSVGNILPDEFDLEPKEPCEVSEGEPILKEPEGGEDKTENFSLAE